VQMNWLSRFLHIKPATRTLCFHVGRGRVRGDLVRLFRDWQRFGVCDVTYDRRANIINARVDKANRKSLPDLCIPHDFGPTFPRRQGPHANKTVSQISRSSQCPSSSNFSSFWSMAIARVSAWLDSPRSEVRHRVSARLSTLSKTYVVPNLCWWKTSRNKRR